jgi:t-SNARE complex subunit (syntaxin)
MSDPFGRFRRREVRARLAALEAEVQEQRQLSRRVAELTDLVTDLLVPLSQRDHVRVEEIVERYRASV